MSNRTNKMTKEITKKQKQQFAINGFSIAKRTFNREKEL